MYKFELHAHTSECDKVARVSGAEVVKLYHDLEHERLAFDMSENGFEWEIRIAI